MIRTEKVIREDDYHKTVQCTDKDKYSEATYCINYIKHFHKDLPGGFKWVKC